MEVETIKGAEILGSNFKKDMDFKVKTYDAIV